MKRIGHVSDAGGGYVTVYVDRDLDNYPADGTDVFISLTDNVDEYESRAAQAVAQYAIAEFRRGAEVMERAERQIANLAQANNLREFLREALRDPAFALKMEQGRRSLMLDRDMVDAFPSEDDVDVVAAEMWEDQWQSDLEHAPPQSQARSRRAARAALLVARDRLTSKL